MMSQNSLYRTRPLDWRYTSTIFCISSRDKLACVPQHRLRPQINCWRAKKLRFRCSTLFNSVRSHQKWKKPKFFQVNSVQRIPFFRRRRIVREQLPKIFPNSVWFQSHVDGMVSGGFSPLRVFLYRSRFFPWRTTSLPQFNSFPKGGTNSLWRFPSIASERKPTR